MFLLHDRNPPMYVFQTHHTIESININVVTHIANSQEVENVINENIEEE